MHSTAVLSPARCWLGTRPCALQPGQGGWRFAALPPAATLGAALGRRGGACLMTAAGLAAAASIRQPLHTAPSSQPLGRPPGLPPLSPRPHTPLQQVRGVAHTGQSGWGRCRAHDRGQRRQGRPPRPLCTPVPPPLLACTQGSALRAAPQHRSSAARAALVGRRPTGGNGSGGRVCGAHLAAMATQAAGLGQRLRALWNHPAGPKVRSMPSACLLHAARGQPGACLAPPAPPLARADAWRSVSLPFHLCAPTKKIPSTSGEKSLSLGLSLSLMSCR